MPTASHKNRTGVFESFAEESEPALARTILPRCK